MFSMKISVIIPVYNGERYIQRALENVCANSLENFEVIIVNDGSIDNSQCIIEKMAKADKRIKYYSIKNCGVSGARNIGLKYATGDYIMFCDCDDEFDSDVINSVYEMINKNYYSFIEFNRIDVSNGILGKKMMNFKNQRKVSVDSYLEDYFSCTSQSCYSVGNKVYSADLIKKYDIYFDSTLGINEDLDFNLRYLMNCNNVLMLPNIKYFRHCNPGSIMFSNIDNFFGQCVRFLDNEKKKGYITSDKVYKNFVLHYSFISIDRYLSGLDSLNIDKKKNVNLIKEYCKKNNIKLFYPINKRFLLISLLMPNTELLVTVMNFIFRKGKL